MQSAKEWILSLDIDGLWAMAMTFIATYGASIFAVILVLIKNKVKQIDVDTKIAAAQSEQEKKMLEMLKLYQDQTINAIENVEKQVIDKNSQYAEERKAALNEIKEATNEVVDELQSTTDAAALIDAIE